MKVVADLEYMISVMFVTADEDWCESAWVWSNDADGNENVKKTSWFNKQNNNFARASRFFAHFFPVFPQLRRENA